MNIDKRVEQMREDSSEDWEDKVSESCLIWVQLLYNESKFGFELYTCMVYHIWPFEFFHFQERPSIVRCLDGFCVTRL